MSEENRLVVFTLADQALALPLAAVERVVRAVETAPAPQAPETLLGMINVGGRILPVFDIRAQFGLPARERELSDHFIIAHTAAQPVALVAEAVRGVINYAPEEKIAAEKIFPGLDGLHGVIKREGEMILICDLDALFPLNIENPAHDQ